MATRRPLHSMSYHRLNDGVRVDFSMPGNSRSKAKIQAAAAKGDAQLDRGEGIEYTDELLDTMTRTALQDMHSDKPIDPDVLPA